VTLITEIALWTLAGCAIPPVTIDLLKFTREIRRRGFKNWWRYG
jgi:hypothetical protein